MTANHAFAETEPAAICCACGDSHYRTIGTFSHWGRTLGSVVCEGCGLARVSPRLTEPAVAHLFSQHYFRDAAPAKWSTRRIPVFEDVRRVLAQIGARSVYDVGAAGGQFMAYLYAHGLRVGGCDISEATVRNSTLPIDLGHIRETRPVGYDAVVNLDTLYYSHDPLADLRAASEAAPWLVLRLRNNRAPRPGRAPAPSDHLWAFTPTTAAQLLQRVPYRIVRTLPAVYSDHPLTRPLNTAVRVAQAAHLPVSTMSFMMLAHRQDE
jgi:hypothetical protein